MLMNILSVWVASKNLSVDCAWRPVCVCVCACVCACVYSETLSYISAVTENQLQQ